MTKYLDIRKMPSEICPISIDRRIAIIQKSMGLFSSHVAIALANKSSKVVMLGLPGEVKAGTTLSKYIIRPYGLPEKIVKETRMLPTYVGTLHVLMSNICFGSHIK